MKRKQRGQNVSGILLLDKPAGITSNGALQRAKALLAVRKAGHTGSLDPIATGLLPLCFGDATKVSSFFLGADKRYQTRIRLGESTDTGDSEGRVISTAAVDVTDAVLAAAIDRFVGEIEQIPPMYSAIKRGGKPLYRLAREGIEVPREPRKATVAWIRVTGRDGPMLDLDIKCSSGFYVRVLAADLGEVLGCGGHVAALRRLEVGDLSLDRSVTLEQIESIESPGERRRLLMPADQALAHLPRVSLSVDAAYYLCRGEAVRAAGLPASGWVRLYAAEAGFLGLGMVMDDGRVSPKRLFTGPAAGSARSTG